MDIPNYITTHSGIDFDFLNPKPEQITIEDIAHALSHKCRFGGHTNKFYSVGHHSLLVAKICDVWCENKHPAAIKLVSLYGLLHDAPEAYMADIPAPMKAYLPDCQDMEYRIWLAICKRFDLSSILPELVKKVDQYMLATEARFFGIQGWERWAPTEPLDMNKWFEPIEPFQVKYQFLEYYQNLTRQD